jgi:hypothetical protein
MPLIAFETLPDEARVWVFAAAEPVMGDREVELLRAVDAYLAQWKAHGMPLTVAREWREHRFLTIGVDTSYEAASGCSIDGLFRVLRELETVLGTTLVGSGNVYFRDGSGAIVTADRETFEALGVRGDVNRETVVFDPSVTTLEDWRARFETTAGASWHGALLPAVA